MAKELVTVTIGWGNLIEISTSITAEVGTPEEDLKKEAIAWIKKEMITPEQLENIETLIDENEAWVATRHLK